MKFFTSGIVKTGIVLAVAALLALSVALFYTVYLPKRYTALVRTNAAEFGLDENLLYAVIRTESKFDNAAVSSAGAVGLMQLMPSTAAFAAQKLGMGQEIDLFDAATNIRIGAWYLSYLLDKFEDTALAIAAYNAGEGTVRNWQREGICSADGKAQIFPYPETENYVRKVKKFYKCYNFCYF